MLQLILSLGSWAGRHPLGAARQTPSMLRNKLLRRSPLRDELPWMPFDAIAFLREYLRPDHQVFEYGSGGSTIFFARHAAHVVSIEHDASWGRVVQETLTDRGIENADLRAIAPEQRPSAQFGSRSPGFEDASFQHYVEAIHEFPPSHFDLIVVDGRARNACLREALPHIKRGGIVVLDNSDRDYAEGKAFYASFEKRLFRGLNPYQLFPGETTAWKVAGAARS